MTKGHIKYNNTINGKNISKNLNGYLFQSVSFIRTVPFGGNLQQRLGSIASTQNRRIDKSKDDPPK